MVQGPPEGHAFISAPSTGEGPTSGAPVAVSSAAGPVEGESREFQAPRSDCSGLLARLPVLTASCAAATNATRNISSASRCRCTAGFSTSTISRPARATEIALRSPRFWAGEQVYLTYSNQTADGFGTITGGLTDFSPPSGYYALDHDQRNTLNAGLHAELPWQAYFTMNLYFGSGFSNGNPPPSYLPSNGSLDLSLGKTFGQQLTASLTVLNVTNKHLLIDNSLTFDGYHWNYPRQIYAALHYRFPY